MSARWTRMDRFGWVTRPEPGRGMFLGSVGIEMRRSVWLWLWAAK